MHMPPAAGGALAALSSRGPGSAARSSSTYHKWQRLVRVTLVHTLVHTLLAATGALVAPIRHEPGSRPQLIIVPGVQV